LLISQFQIIPLDEVKELLNLVWLGFAVNLLQIDHLSNIPDEKRCDGWR